MSDGCGEIPVKVMEKIATKAGLSVKSYLPSAVQIRVCIYLFVIHFISVLTK